MDENGPFIVDLPIKNGDCPVRQLLVITRWYILHNPKDLISVAQLNDLLKLPTTWLRSRAKG